MNMKKTLVVLLFAIIGISVSAQDRTVTGKVTDAKDGAPLVAASVAVKEAPREQRLQRMVLFQ